MQAAVQPGKQGGLPKWLGIAGASYLSRRGEIEVELLMGISPNPESLLQDVVAFSLILSSRPGYFVFEVHKR
jgi:hypothetical protein